MSYETIANTIRSRYKTLIADVYSVPTQYDNQDESSFAKPKNLLWTKVLIQWGEDKLASFGGPTGNKYRQTGSLNVTISVPLGQGTQPGLALADKIKTAFLSVQVSGINFKIPQIKRIGRLGSEWLYQVTCPFRTDSTS